MSIHPNDTRQQIERVNEAFSEMFADPYGPFTRIADALERIAAVQEGRVRERLFREGMSQQDIIARRSLTGIERHRREARNIKVAHPWLAEEEARDD